MPYQKYPQNIDYYLYKYIFFDVKTSTIKTVKFSLHIHNFRIQDLNLKTMQQN